VIKTILFDLGNVLLPLDVEKTYNAFEALSAKSTLHKELPLFHSWEKGELGSDKFYAELRSHLKYQAHNNSIKVAWNGMLLPFPEENISLLKKLKKKYRLVLISNINHIHEEAIKEMMGAFKYGQMLKQFSGIYYSHHDGMRKPDEAFFNHATRESALKPEETLFIDDTEENIISAKKLGFQTWHFNPNTDNILNIERHITKIFKKAD